MNIADICIAHPAERRNIGIHFDNHNRVVDTAKKLYVEYGIACDITGDTITYPVPHIAAAWWAGAIERITGLRSFNDWEN